jgi:hypothetical protein
VLREKSREAAIDRLREKFGPGVLQKGIVLRGPQR